MKATPLSIPSVLMIEPQVFIDNRGLFFESFNQDQFKKLVGYKVEFVQDNHSQSGKGVLRGLHYQMPPKVQGKLVRVIQGKIFDVAVDLRESSPSFGQWASCILSAENKIQMWIPEGFAHGFLALSDDTEVLYKTTNPYSPEHQRELLWNDPFLNIKWPLSDIFLSEKDSNAKRFEEISYFN